MSSLKDNRPERSKRENNEAISATNVASLTEVNEALASPSNISVNTPLTKAVVDNPKEQKGPRAEGEVKVSRNEKHGQPFRFNKKTAIPMESILEQIGHTPLVQLKRIPLHYGFKSKIYAKCEFMNPSGSIKDRLALGLKKKLDKMPDLLSKGGTLVSANDSDFAISLAMVSTLEGYNTISLLQPEVAAIKKDALKLLGSKSWIIPEIIGKLPNIVSAKSSLMTSAGCKLAKDFVSKSPNSSIFVSDHLEGTYDDVKAVADEIFSEGIRPDVFVGPKDSQGVMQAISDQLLMKNPKCEVIPVEGVWDNEFKPDISTTFNIAVSVTCTERDALFFTREIIREEGILCGPSGGAMLWAALEAIKRYELDSDKTITVVICISDSLDLSRKDFLLDSWMMQKGYYSIEDIHRQSWWYGVSIGNLKFQAPPCVSVKKSMGAVEAVLKASNCQWLIFVNEESRTPEEAIVGVATQKLLQDIKNGIYDKDQCLENTRESFDENFGRIGRHAKLGELEGLLKKHPYVVVFYEASLPSTNADSSVRRYHYPIGVATLCDIFEWVIEVENHHRITAIKSETSNPIFDD